MMHKIEVSIACNKGQLADERIVAAALARSMKEFGGAKVIGRTDYVLPRANSYDRAPWDEHRVIFEIAA